MNLGLVEGKGRDCWYVQGQIFMTHPTRQVCGMLLKDFVKVSRGSSEGLYTEKDLEDALARTQLIDFNQTIEINGIKVQVSTSGEGPACAFWNWG